jgi:N-acetylmuramic acid 6-phosphate etherase
MIDLKKMDTEKVNENSVNLSSMSIKDAVKLFNDEDYNAVKCIEPEFENITKVIEITSKALSNGGRIIYIGAGTSGRLGLIDAVECPPTFGVDYNTVVGVIAGGQGAFVKAKEGAEDNQEQAIEELKEVNLTSKDVLIGIAASGRTPYVIGGMKYAMSIGCEIAAVVCNYNSQMKNMCANTIEIVPGPEVLTGSTRLKAGTATKLVLNMISTISMISQGKIFKNYMVDVKMSNKKLIQRGINIISEVTECNPKLAESKLKEANNSVKTAIVMILLDCGFEEANERLSSNDDNIERLLHN